MYALFEQLVIFGGGRLVDQFLFFDRWRLVPVELFWLWRSRGSSVFNSDHVFLRFDVLERHDFIEMIFSEAREDVISIKHLLRVRSWLWRW
jgi:hypothetical protein